MNTKRTFAVILISCLAWLYQYLTRVFPSVGNRFLFTPSATKVTLLQEEKALQTTKDYVSPVCRPSWGRETQQGNGHIKRLFFSHTRKAGGTMLAKFFRLVAQTHGWKFVSVEGTPAEAPIRNDTFYVTHLREPVARAISMYKYGGRWSCRKMVFPNRYPDFVPSANNSRSLEDYMEKESNKPEQQQCLKIPERKKKLWGCAKNCYLRWYGKPFNCLTNIERSYHTARKKLLGYNLIVIMERMRDPSYVQGLIRMFGKLETDILSTKQKIHCDEESRYWNKKYPAIIENSTLAKLSRLNKWDMRLYDELNDCPDGVVFPGFSGASS